MSRRIERQRLVRAASILLAAVVATAGCREVPEGLSVSRQGAVQRSLDESRRTAIVNAVEIAASAVVSVNATVRQRIVPRSRFDALFLPPGAEREVRSSGTGLIVLPDGVIVTNQHVVAGAEHVVVTLADGREFDGQLLGEDPLTDIAVIRIPGRDLPVSRLGSSEDLMIGEWVVALGNPYAYLLGNAEPTVTVGVVSATGRNILPSENQVGLYLDMIQTDAAINPGNSGGPLVNASGEVVGINSSILSNSGGSVGLGFAIPIERAVRVADEIVRTGTVRRAWLGLEVAGPGQAADWRHADGVQVTSVAPDGPAASAGMRPGDVLVSAAGHPLRNYLDWEAVKLDLHVGDAVTARIRREDDARDVRIVSADLPTVTAAKVTVLRDLELVTVTPAIQAEREIRSDQGALLYRLSDAVSRATGLRAGDVIIAINRTAVRSAQEFADLVNSLPPGQPFRVTFERGTTYSWVDLSFR